jgi:hypothetical protein
MITKKKINHELYVYFNGDLMYKRWIYTDKDGHVNYSYGKVFDNWSQK